MSTQEKEQKAENPEKENPEEGSSKLKQYNDQVFEISKTHFKKFNLNSINDLDVKDISGNSNTTFIVHPKENELKKVVIRFFESKVSNFDLERDVFRRMSEKGIGPKAKEMTD